MCVERSGYRSCDCTSLFGNYLNTTEDPIKNFTFKCVCSTHCKCPCEFCHGRVPPDVFTARGGY